MSIVDDYVAAVQVEAEKHPVDGAELLGVRSHISDHGAVILIGMDVVWRQERMRHAVGFAMDKFTPEEGARAAMADLREWVESLGP